MHKSRGEMCGLEGSYEAVKILRVRNDEKPKLGQSREDGKESRSERHFKVKLIDFFIDVE